jgi:polysaccharide chain length determinant protein (PEP-CTERM system associated)
MEDHEMTPNDYLGVLKRRKWSLLIPAALFFIISIIVALALPPVYQSISTILIEEQEIPADFVMSTVTSYAEQRLQTINQRIMSSTRLLEIINRLDLYPDLRETATTEEIVAEMRDNISLEYISADIVDRRTGRPATATIAFTLGYESTGSPATVQKVANVLASLFLEENLQVRERQALEATTFLEEELDKVKADLEAVEKKVADFKNIHINELPEMLSMNMQSLHTVEMTIDRVNEQLRSLEERKETLEIDLANLSPKLIMEDKSRLEQLKLDLTHMETKFSPLHPDVIKTKAEIAELEKKVNAKPATENTPLPDNPAYITMTSQIGGLGSQIDSIRRQLKELETKAAGLQRRIKMTPNVEEKYNALLSERSNLQGKYDDLSRKLMEAKVSYGLEKEQKGERFTLIDPARLPEEPSKPNRLAIILIGLVLGLGAGVGTAALKEFSDQSFYNAKTLSDTTSFPVLAIIPQITTDEDLQKKAREKKIIFFVAIAGLIITVLLFHFLVMDLSVFWAKLTRKIG